MKNQYFIVDENDNVIGAKIYRDITDDDIYRVSSVWVVSGKKVLIQQRELNDVHEPGKWQPSAAGTVGTNESYETNALNELAEEIGLTGVELEPMYEKPKFHDGKHKYFHKRFVVQGDWQLSDFTPQESEVEALDLVDIDDLLRDIDKNPDKYLIGFHENVSELKQYLEAQK
jgi:8-oxo-dGTP pyrophosphatase MutT (NUDIX family)